MAGSDRRGSSTKFGLVCPDVAGHLNPLTTLGVELRCRGHEVAVIGGRPARRFAERQGLAFVPIGVGGDRESRDGLAWEIWQKG